MRKTLHRRSTYLWRLAASFIVLAVTSCASTDEHLEKTSENDVGAVITATQVTYSLTSALLAGTPIEVINVPADGRKFEGLKDYISRRMDTLRPVFEDADAVISMMNVLPADPLFRFARQANIAMVNIDAGQPWSFDQSGVAIVRLPTSNVDWAQEKDTQRMLDAPYFWLSISNAVRMVDIISADLSRVYPVARSTILQNQESLKQTLLSLYREYQNHFIRVSDINIFALANDFVYLTNDFGLYVDGYFIKQDIDWSDTDLLNLSKHIKSRDINVVIHKWQPSAEIVEAIQQAGATLVVLDTANPGMSLNRELIQDGYQKIMRQNLAALLKAVSD